MGRVTKKYYGYCPLVEDFHIRNVLGSRERRQIIFGYTATVTAADGTKALTLSGMTGGLITHVDHYQVFVQGLQAATVRPRVKLRTEDSSLGFTLLGDDGSVTPKLYSVIIVATLPSHPRATPKWAKDYCPGCKNLDFYGLVGSIYKDIGLFSMRVQNGGAGTLAVKFATHTAYYNDETTDLWATGVKGSTESPLVNQMANDDYQIMISPSATAPAAYPYASSITAAGFTLTGDASEYFNILILGQIRN